jgi:hypothetical protein
LSDISKISLACHNVSGTAVLVFKKGKGQVVLKMMPLDSNVP